MSTDQIESEDRSDTDPDTVIEIENATVSFPSGRGRARPLNDVSFEVKQGEILGIIGESGSGKSMFASAVLDSVVEPGVLTGSVRYYPEEGDPVVINELSPAEVRGLRWESLALLPQGAMSVFNPVRDIETHFRETLDSHGRDEDEGMDRARELLREVNLEPESVFDNYAYELSGGQKQRILIALSLLLDPDVLIMDEPTSALDLLMQRQVLNHLYQVREEYDLTIVIISHDLPLVTGFAQRLAIMYAFEIIEVGDARDILGNPSHPYTRALLRSTPSLSMDPEDIQGIEGRSPDPVNIPSGCSYHPRCPLADDRCEIEDPALAEIEPGHTAACFYWDQAADAVPLDLTEDEE